jgi:hypothetical protein
LKAARYARVEKDGFCFLFPSDRDFFLWAPRGAPEERVPFIPERASEPSVRLTLFSLCVCLCVFVNFTGRVREILRPVVRGMRSRSFFFSFFAREPAAPFLSKSHFKARADVVLLLLRERRMRRYDMGFFDR